MTYDTTEDEPAETHRSSDSKTIGENNEPVRTTKLMTASACSSSEQPTSNCSEPEDSNLDAHLNSCLSSSSSASSSENNGQEDTQLGDLSRNGTKNAEETNEQKQQQIQLPSCYDEVLDDEIRARLDKLNALSDLINSLERHFDEANLVFRETLKCSTDRLSTIAKTLGSKSIRHGRIYQAAKLIVEQSQTDCQRACVQFEQANHDHQSAKDAIKEAELKLREISGKNTAENGTMEIPGDAISRLDQLKITETGTGWKNCDTYSNPSTTSRAKSPADHDCRPNSDVEATNNNFAFEKLDSTVKSAFEEVPSDSTTCGPSSLTARNTVVQNDDDSQALSLCLSLPPKVSNGTAEISEELNQAILRLIEADRKRGQSERQHLDQTNKLMLAQDHLMRLEREHGQSIRRSQFYFDEAKRFDAKLNSVKGDICRISDEILAAKQAYARTLSELEQFSEDLHVNSASRVADRVTNRT